MHTDGSNWFTSLLTLRSTAAASLIMVAVAQTACTATNAEQGPPPTPQIPVAKPLVQAIAPTQQFPARVEAIDRVELRPRVSGYVEQVLFEEGAIVRKGEPLVRIDPRPYRARLNEAHARLELARADLVLAHQEQDRAHRLVARSAIAVQELDRREAALAAARARVAAANAAHEQAALELSYTEIRAPISGRIGRALVTVGNLVSAADGGGTLLATLISTDPVYVTFDLDEKTAAQAGREGEHVLPVRFLAAGGATEALGTLAFLDNELGNGTGTLRARAQLENTDGVLVPGMLGRVTVTLNHLNESLLIDDKAVGTDQGQRYVLVAGASGAVEYRPIETGGLHGALRVVRHGLSAEDQVVVNGLMKVQPGAVIKPVQVSMERTAAGDYSPMTSSVVATAE